MAVTGRLAAVLGCWMLLGGAVAAQEMGDAIRGEVVYQRHCATCHGTALDGRGPMAAVLSRRPADLSGLGSDPDIERLVARIEGRGATGAHVSAMPSYAMVLTGPERPVPLPDGGEIMVYQPVLDLMAYFTARASD